MSYVGNKPAQTTIPVDDSVTTAMLKDDAVTSAKIDDGTIATADIADDAVTVDKVANAINTSIAANTSKVTNATHTGDVTGATALTIATDAVDIAMLSATGTADSTTFLRGDNAWAAAGGDNTPAFQAYMSANTAIAYDTGMVLPFNTVDFDTDSAYDNTTNYRFTVPAGEGGKYFVYSRLTIAGSGNSTHNYSYSYVRVNGSAVFWRGNDDKNNPGHYVSYENYGILTLSAADYVDCSGYIATADSAAGVLFSEARATAFGAYKMIGL